MPQDRNALLVKAVEKWSASLLDMTGNNRLIYYRELDKGTLGLTGCLPGVVDRLNGGEEVLVSELFGAKAYQSDLEPDEELAKRLAQANKKAKTVYNKWKIYQEEKGISILFLTKGFLTWPKDPSKTSEPNAPLLIAPLEMQPVGAARSDFKIQKVEDWQVNETLLLFLDETFETNLLGQGIGERLRGDHEALTRHIDGLVPGTEFTCRPDQVIGNFTYTKLPMVRDLQDNIQMLEDHDLIAAIAGDSEAEADLREANASGLPELSDPNYVPLADEYLVLDADSSQNYVINAAIASKSLVVEGPPGTGKSQTIANTIASLTARGRSVLFVAEKRAAIDAVAKRLAAVGLQDLVFDLHAKELKTKDVAQGLKATRESTSEVVHDDYKQRHKSLETKRTALLEYEEALHRSHKPWDLSNFGVSEKLLAHPSDTSVVFDRDATEQLTEDRIQAIGAVIDTWTSQRLDLGWNSKWIGTPVSDSTEAGSFVSIINDLVTSLLPKARRTLEALEVELDRSLDELLFDELLDLFELSGEIQAREELFDSGVWTLDLRDTLADLQKQYFSKDNRATRRLLRPMQRASLWPPSKLVAAVEKAAALQDRWNDFGLGVTPSGLFHTDGLRDQVRQVTETLAFLGDGQIETLATLAFGQTEEHVAELDSDRDVVFQLGQLANNRSQLCEMGLRNLVEKVEQGDVEERDAKSVFLHSAYQAIKRQIDLNDPQIAAFSSTTHNGVVKDFVEGEIWHQDSTADRIRRKAAENRIRVQNAHPRQADVLVREMLKKTRHKKFRELQDLAPDVLTSMKPCWMMSPLMVSQVLPPRSLFDFVIFDEASQIRPEDAVCAIARGKNTIVAGDRRQLPPSKFFDGGDGDGDGEEEDDASNLALTEGYESILDVTSALLPLRMLTWHYRSRDERLIALSNAHIYGGALVTFPGSMQESPISWHYVDYTPNDESEIRSNHSEVNKVVDLVLEHANQQEIEIPDIDSDEVVDVDEIETLGVIAFGQYHASAIEDALHSRLRDLNDESLNFFFDPERREPFFVKNLERVQGDERDCIVLSVGYGKDPDGNVPQRFGPINTEGGERRINVAASRARSKMTVVSSISESDVTAQSGKKGPKLLKALLGFAKSLGNEVGLHEERTNLNPFELQVQFELEKLGLNVIPQYGVGKYRIDFVLTDPNDPNRLVLAVESDGASYHSSQTARDRDRLRQQILEDKGWRFCRIWSTDFFRDPQAEARKVQEALRRALAGEEELVESQSDSAAWRPPPRSRPSSHRPTFLKGVPVTRHDIRQLVALVRWLTEDGQKLLTDEELRYAMRDELGYDRLGAAIRVAFDRAIGMSRGELEIPPPPVQTSPKSSTKTSSSTTGSKTNCPCGGLWVKRSGPHGSFYGCSNFHSKGCRKKRPK